jgi:hypothetical protein
MKPLSYSRSHVKTALVVAALLAFGAVAAAWAMDDSPKDSAISKLAWMVGAWRCADTAEPVEEHWSDSRNGVMLGMCRIGPDAERALYEIILIEEKEGAPVMSIRHFRKGLIERDKKIAAFKLTKCSDKEAVFEDPANDFPSRLIYRASTPDRLLIRLEGSRNGKPQSKDFPMDRLRS